MESLINDFSIQVHSSLINAAKNKIRFNDFDNKTYQLGFSVEFNNIEKNTGVAANLLAFYLNYFCIIGAIKSIFSIQEINLARTSPKERVMYLSHVEFNDGVDIKELNNLFYVELITEIGYTPKFIELGK